jgi:hypothetical protein
MADWEGALKAIWGLAAVGGLLTETELRYLNKIDLGVEIPKLKRRIACLTRTGSQSMRAGNGVGFRSGSGSLALSPATHTNGSACSHLGCWRC